MKDQYLLLVFAFSFMAAYRLTISMNLRAILQMSLFAIPLTALIMEGENGVTEWAYACLAVAVVWWFADLYTLMRSARIAYRGNERYRTPSAKAAAPKARVARPTVTAERKAPEPEKVELVSIKPQDIVYGPVIGLVEERPIYEWLTAQGRPGRAEYIGILGKGATLEDNDLMLMPGLVYRWTTPSAVTARHQEAAEVV